MKLILLSLADRADEKHCCYPSIIRMEKDTGLNRKTVLSGLKKLSEMGLISVKKATGKSNYYQLNGVHGREQTSTKNGTGTENGTSTKNGTRTSTKNGTTPVPKTVPESTKNLPMNLPIGIDRELFEEFWFVVRPKKKAVNSERAMKLILTELEKIKSMGHDPNECLAKSVRAGWSDVYPDKNKPEQKTPRRKFPQ